MCICFQQNARTKLDIHRFPVYKPLGIRLVTQIEGSGYAVSAHSLITAQPWVQSKRLADNRHIFHLRADGYNDALHFMSEDKRSLHLHLIPANLALPDVQVAVANSRISVLNKNLSTGKGRDLSVVYFQRLSSFSDCV